MKVDTLRARQKGADDGTEITVSIIVPCYNAATWIAETVVSAVSQQGVRHELLVVDDGSTDGSADVACASIPATTDFCIIREPHRGVSHARNVGTRLARGRFVQYLDSDDLLEGNTLAQRVRALEESGADVAYCDWRLWERQSDGSFGSGAVICRALGDRPEVKLLAEAWWPPGAVLYRREVIEKIGLWDEGLTITQDAHFLLRAASQGGKFARVENVGLRYRVLESSLSQRTPSLLILESCWSAFDIQRLWTNDAGLDPLRRTALLSLYRYLARAVASDAETAKEVARRIVDLESCPDRHFSCELAGGRMPGQMQSAHATDWSK